MALPTFYPQFDDPTRNLAGGLSTLAALDAIAQDTPAVVQAPLAPTAPRNLYRAWDGTPIGYSSDCDPLTDEPQLSGVIVPDFLEDNRIEGGQEWVLPLILGFAAWKTGAYESGAGTAIGLAGVLAAYMAPLPVAGLLIAGAMLARNQGGVR